MLRLTAHHGPNSLGPHPIGAVSVPVERGPVGSEAVSQIQSLLRELASPLALASFASGILAARVATGAYLVRSSVWGWRTLLASQAVGLGTEIAAMTASRRLGAQIFLGARDQWHPSEVAREMLLMAGPFALLRVNQQIFAQWKPITEAWCRSALRSVLKPAAHLAGDVLAVVGGHGVNRALNWEEVAPGGHSLLYSGLLTVAHMRLAGHLIAPLTSRSLDRIVQLHEKRLRSLRAAGPGGEDSGPSRLGHSALIMAAAGGPPLASPARSHWSDRLYMMGDKNSNGPSHKPGETNKAGESQPPPSSDRSEAIRSELESRLAELRQEVAQSPLNEKVEHAAGSLQGLLESYRRDPQQVDARSFQKMLHTVQQNLTQAQAIGKNLQDRLRNLRVFLEQVRERTAAAPDKTDPTKTPVAGRPPIVTGDESPGLIGTVFSRLFGDAALSAREGIKGIVARVRGRVPSRQAVEQKTPTSDLPQEVQRELEAVAAQVEAKEKQGTQLQQALKNLEALRWYLELAAQQGLSDHGQWALNRRVVKLRSLFPNLRWEAIPWAQATGDLAVRRNGVLLALGARTPHMKTDTALARRLRGEGVGEPRDMELDADLEVLQQGLLLGAGWQGSMKNMNRALDHLVSEYGGWNHSGAVVRLAAETTHQLVMGKISHDSLLGFLAVRTQEGPLQTLFTALKGNVLSGRSLSDSLFTFTGEATAQNYFFSSLGLLLQSSKQPQRFAEYLSKMDEVSENGFHPSVALGLFGAVYGQGKLPSQFLPKDLNLDVYLNRAQEEFLQGTSETWAGR